MNIKIKSSGVYCLVGDDYDRVYHVLRNQFEDGNLQLFTERIPGHEYLQWELPGDGWTALADADTLLAVDVRKELLSRQKAVSERFGTNQEMAQRVLSVPDDHYVFFKESSDGSLQIRLTAWGYRYPERVLGGAATGEIPGSTPKEVVSIHLLYDGKPMAGKPVRLNGRPRMTDSSGTIEIGDVPVGYQFDVDVNNVHRHVTVEKGEGNLVLDLTEYTTLEVRVTRDAQPFEAARISVAYMGRNEELVADANGYASIKLPLDPENRPCAISAEGETQQHPLEPVSTTVCFDFVTPPPPAVEEPLPEVPEEELPPEEPVYEETLPEEPVPLAEPEPSLPEDEPEVLPEEEVQEEPPVEEPVPKDRGMRWWWWLIFAILTAITYWVSIHFFI